MRAKTKSVAVLLASAMMLGSVNVWAVESPEASMTEHQETQQTAYEFSFEGFQSAVRDGLAAREVLGTALKDEKLTDAEIQERYRAIAESEWEKLKTFDQDFPNAMENEVAKNENYVRKTYVEGVKKQKDAGKNEGEDSFAEEWQTGYEMRTRALTELAVCYECAFDEDVKAELLLTDETDESGDEGLVKVIQAFGVASGKLSNDPTTLDGKAGNKTIAALKDMQAEKEIPTIGIINRNRVKELKEAYPDLVEKVNTLLSGSGLTVETYLPQEVSQPETIVQ